MKISVELPVKFSREKPWNAWMPPLGQVSLLRNLTSGVGDAVGVADVDVGADDVVDGGADELAVVSVY